MKLLHGSSEVGEVSRTPEEGEVFKIGNRYYTVTGIGTTMFTHEKCVLVRDATIEEIEDAFPGQIILVIRD